MARRKTELDLILFWTTLLVLVVVNFFMSVALIPFFLLAQGLPFFLMVALLALFFGYIFTMLVRNIENLDAHHHLLAVLFVPVFAVINLVLISISMRHIAQLLGFPSSNALMVALVYLGFFLLPYVIYKK